MHVVIVPLVYLGKHRVIIRPHSLVCELFISSHSALLGSRSYVKFELGVRHDVRTDVAPVHYDAPVFPHRFLNFDELFAYRCKSRAFRCPHGYLLRSYHFAYVLPVEHYTTVPEIYSGIVEKFTEFAAVFKRYPERSGFVSDGPVHRSRIDVIYPVILCYKPGDGALSGAAWSVYCNSEQAVSVSHHLSLSLFPIRLSISFMKVPTSVNCL